MLLKGESLALEHPMYICQMTTGVVINFVQPLNMWCMLLVVIMLLKSTSVIKHVVIKRHCALNTCTIVLCRHMF